MTKANITLILLISVIFSLGGTSTAFAQLYFDQEIYISGHEGYLIFNGTNADDETATISGAASATVTFSKIDDTTFKSTPFVPSTSSSTTVTAEFLFSGETISTAVEDAVSLPNAYRENKYSFQDIDVSGCTDAEVVGPYIGDGICDEWEKPSGLEIDANGITLEYPCKENAGNHNHPDYDPTGATVCPSSETLDVYFEIDSMKNHAPSNSTLKILVEVFKAYNINLHLFVDEKDLPHVDDLRYPGSARGAGYDQLKVFHYGTSDEHDDELNGIKKMKDAEKDVKNLVFHYVIFGHDRFRSGGASGIAETPGNDALITLGSWDGMVGTEDQQAATLMHEVGHNFGLDHGGDESVNCKPNYISIMSHSRQFDDYVVRDIDYSNQDLSDIDEYSDQLTIDHYPTSNPFYDPARTIFSDGSGVIQEAIADGSTLDLGTAQELNSFAEISTCNSDGQESNMSSHDDWSNLIFVDQGDANYNDGISSSSFGFILPSDLICQEKMNPGNNPINQRICVSVEMTPQEVANTRGNPDVVNIMNNALAEIQNNRIVVEDRCFGGDADACNLMGNSCLRGNDLACEALDSACNRTSDKNSVACTVRVLSR